MLIVGIQSGYEIFNPDLRLPLRILKLRTRHGRVRHAPHRAAPVTAAE
jgi:hypothetical protein